MPLPIPQKGSRLYFSAVAMHKTLQYKNETNVPRITSLRCYAPSTSTLARFGQHLVNLRLPSCMISLWVFIHFGKVYDFLCQRTPSPFPYEAAPAAPLRSASDMDTTTSMLCRDSYAIVS